MNHRWIAWIVLAALTGLAGCQTSVPEAKIQATKRWEHTRSQMACGMAGEYLKSGQLDKAAAKAQEALVLDEQNLPARITLGKVYIEQGQYGSAAAELTKVVRQTPASAEAVYYLAIAQEKVGQLEDALSNYRRTYVLDSSNIAPVVAAGEVMVALGRVPEAQRFIEGYLPQGGSDPALYELAGRLAMMQEEYPQAVKHYSNALDLDHKNLCYRQMLACAQFEAGLFSETVETLQVLRQEPNCVCPAWVYGMMGDSYMALNRPRDARDLYVKRQELQPRAPEAWTDLGKAALALGDEDRAMDSARSALSLEPKNADAAGLLGYSLLRKGLFIEAVGALAPAVAAHGDNAVLRCLLGRAYQGCGNEAEAKQCFSAALKAEPGNELAKLLLSSYASAATPAGP